MRYLLMILFLFQPLRADTFVFVSESKDKTIATFRLETDSGDLERVSEIECGGSPGCLWRSADQTKLYASIRSNSKFATFEINPENGSLKLLNTAPSAGSAAYVYPDKTGKWLLAAYYGEGLASVSKIVDGVVTGPPVQIFETGKKAHCIQTSPDNRFAFVPHPVELNKVHQFRFDEATGKLIDNEPNQMAGREGAGPRHIQFHPNGKWAYVVNEQGKSVTHCLYDSTTGLLSRKSTLTTIPADWPQTKGSCADIEISEDGNFLYGPIC